MHEYEIKADGLTKRFGDILAVDHIDIRVKKGQIFGLVGPDGAGKTTTIRMLVTIMAPSEGQAAVMGYDTQRQAEHIKDHIGYMPQRFSLYPDLTVTENLYFYAELYQVPHAKRAPRAAELLEWSNLTNHTYKLAEQLSGGMKQKLALACNLIHEPDVLFLDEPSTGVDPVARREFWKILFRLREEGKTILVSTPYMDEAERCDMIGFMHNGRILATGKPDEIRALFAKQLLELRAEQVEMLHTAREHLREHEGVSDVLIYGDSLHLVVEDADTSIPPLRQMLEGHGVRVASFRRIQPSLEDAFAYLVRGHGGFVGKGVE